MPSHQARRTLRYTPEQLFDLAADVERYPEFLPWWRAARVRRREGNVYYTEQAVGFGLIRARFRSRTLLQRPRRIDVTARGGIFRSFELTWCFDALPEGASEVALSVAVELHSRLMQDLFASVLPRTVGPVMSAFETRARRLYGAAPPPSAARRDATGGPAA